MLIWNVANQVSLIRLKVMIYIDCSNTYQRNFSGGISRVVKEITKNLSKIAPDEVSLVIYANKGYYKLPISLQFKPVKSSLSSKLGSFEKSNRGAKLKYKITAIPLLYCLLQYLRSYRVKYKHLDKVALKNNDILFLADSNWMSPAKKKVLLKKKQKGVKILYLIYDLIPLKRPDFFHQAHIRTFQQHIANSLQLACGYITISASIATELKALLEQKNKSHLRVKYFYLGANILPSLQIASQTIRSSIQSFLSTTAPVYLVVSTIEPRKNHAFLLQIFDKLWAQGFKGRLCLVGRSGWLTSELQQQILTHPQINNRLVWWQDISDNELQFIYQQTSVLLSPTLEEGFGLPIVEALQNNLPVIASDIPTHQEISKGQATLITVNDTKAWENSILSHAKRDKQELNYQWMTWKESSEILLQQIKSMG